MSSILLAVDTSTQVIGISLYDGNSVLSESIWASRNHHTTELAPAVQRNISNINLSVSEIGAISVCLGPGSFTGLRIGMSFAKGICLARKIPLIGIPTLDVLAASQPILDIPMIAVLRAGRGRLAAAQYASWDGVWQMSQEIEILTAKELAAGIHTRTYICGELTPEERRIIARKHKNALIASPAQCTRRPSFLAEAGWRRWQEGKVDNPATLSPVYLHYGESIPG